MHFKLNRIELKLKLKCIFVTVPMRFPVLLSEYYCRLAEAFVSEYFCGIHVYFGQGNVSEIYTILALSYFEHQKDIEIRVTLRCPGYIIFLYIFIRTSNNSF